MHSRIQKKLKKLSSDTQPVFSKTNNNNNNNKAYINLNIFKNESSILTNSSNSASLSANINLQNFNEKITAKSLLITKSSANFQKSPADKTRKSIRKKISSYTPPDTANSTPEAGMSALLTTTSCIKTNVNTTNPSTTIAQPSVSKLSSSLRKSSNLNRQNTFCYGYSKNFNSVIDGKSFSSSINKPEVSEEKPKPKTPPSSINSFRNSSEANSRLQLENNNININSSSSKYLNELNINLPNIQSSGITYSVINRSLLNDLKESSRKIMPLNENSIKKIRKILKLEDFRLKCTQIRRIQPKQSIQ